MLNAPTMSTLVTHAGFYLVVFLVALNLTQAWLHTNIAVHFWNALSKDKVVSKSELQDRVFARYGAWGELLLCPLCSSTWLTVIPAVVAGCVLNVAWPWAPLFTIFSIPALVSRALPVQPGVANRTLRPAASNVHPVILDLLRKMAEDPDAEPPPLWVKLYAELQNPQSPKTQALVAAYLRQVKLTKDGEAKQGLLQATLGKIYDAGIR